MDIEKLKNEVAVRLNETIADAETLIARCESALEKLESVTDLDTAKKYDDEVSADFFAEYKHIELI